MVARATVHPALQKCLNAFLMRVNKMVERRCMTSSGVAAFSYKQQDCVVGRTLMQLYV